MRSELLFFIYGVLGPNQPKDAKEAEEWSNRVQDTTEVIEVGSKAEKEFAIMQQQLGWRFGPTPKEAAETVANTAERFSSYRETNIFGITCKPTGRR